MVSTPTRSLRCLGGLDRPLLTGGHPPPAGTDRRHWRTRKATEISTLCSAITTHRVCLIFSSISLDGQHTHAEVSLSPHGDAHRIGEGPGSLEPRRRAIAAAGRSSPAGHTGGNSRGSGEIHRPTRLDVPPGATGIRGADSPPLRWRREGSVSTSGLWFGPPATRWPDRGNGPLARAAGPHDQDAAPGQRDGPEREETGT